MNPRFLIVALALIVAVGTPGRGADDSTPPKGLRVLSAGHSFHVFMPGILKGIAAEAGIKEHVQVDVSSIGGSRVIQHWNLPDEKNKGKLALKTGKVDVMTMSPIYLPDEGIGNFVKLALEHNPDIRLVVQEFWLPYDVYAPDYQKKRPEPVDRNSRTGEDMRKEHAPYFKSMDDHVRALNQQAGKDVVFVCPCGQAVILLREKIIAGQAPGLKMQNDLFTDPIGHVRQQVQTLVAYCHFAVLYRKSPVGLPIKATTPEGEKLARLVQELAWQAVTEHPLSGVKLEKKAN